MGREHFDNPIPPTPRFVDRTPPQDIPAEQASLGAALISGAAVEHVLEALERGDFYHEAHRKVFDALAALAEKDTPADLLTVPGWLAETGTLESIGGVKYVNDLADSVPTAAHVEYYAGKVKGKSRRRKLIEACNEIIAEAYDESQEVEEVLNRAEQRMFGVVEVRENQEPQGAFELMTDTTDSIFYGSENPVLKTGLASLDYLVEGLEDGDFVILAGRPSMGKSDLGCVQLPLNWLRQGVKVAIFSLEMPRIQLGRRFLANLSGEDSFELRKPGGGTADPASVRRASSEIRQMPLWVQDSERMPSSSVVAIRAQMRRMVRKYGIQVFIIDQLQTIDEVVNAESEQVISQTVYRLQRATKALGVRTILQCQLNRKVEGREDKRPFLSDLRSSGSIEQAADHVWLLYRPAYYQRGEDTGSVPDSEEGEEVEIIVAKGRSVRTGTAKVRARLSRSWWWCPNANLDSLEDSAPPENSRAGY